MYKSFGNSEGHFAFHTNPCHVSVSQTYGAFAFAFPPLNAAQGGTKSRRVAARHCVLLHQNLQGNETLVILFCHVRKRHKYPLIQSVLA